MVVRERFAACCDIGGTKVLLGLVDEEGRIASRHRYLLGNDRSPEAMVRELTTRFQDLLAAAGLEWGDVAGVGCSAAVMADVAKGIVLSAPNMLGAHENVPFRDMVQEATGRPALIEMDAYAAALGEAWQGAGRGVDYFVYVVVGTGVGAGILMEGSVFRGWHGTAGEFGHITIEPNGPLCNCGRHGCLEALASGPAIALRAHEALRQGRGSLIEDLAGGSAITPETVFRAARQGDAVALDVVEQTIEYLAIGLVNVIHLLNPRVIALGGGVATGGADLIIEPLRETVAQRCGSWVDVEGTRIVLASLGEDAPLLGVGRLVWDRIGATEGGEARSCEG